MRPICRALWLSGLAWVSIGQAAPPVSAQTEVNLLLGFVDGSGCEFYRNGTWYDAKEAQGHLRDKYRYLAARSMIGSAEDFIEKAATSSRLSGQPYQVRCAGQAAVPSSSWLREELLRLRKH